MLIETNVFKLLTSIYDLKNKNKSYLEDDSENLEQLDIYLNLFIQKSCQEVRRNIEKKDFLSGKISHEQLLIFYQNTGAEINKKDIEIIKNIGNELFNLKQDQNNFQII